MRANAGFPARRRDVGTTSALSQAGETGRRDGPGGGSEGERLAKGWGTSIRERPTPFPYRVLARSLRDFVAAPMFSVPKTSPIFTRLLSDIRPMLALIFAHLARNVRG